MRWILRTMLILREKVELVLPDASVPVAPMHRVSGQCLMEVFFSAYEPEMICAHKSALAPFRTNTHHLIFLVPFSALS